MNNFVQQRGKWRTSGAWHFVCAMHSVWYRVKFARGPDLRSKHIQWNIQCCQVKYLGALYRYIETLQALVGFNGSLYGGKEEFQFETE